MTFDTWAWELHAVATMCCIENCSITVKPFGAGLAWSLLELILVFSALTRHLISTSSRTMMSWGTGVLWWSFCLLPTWAVVACITWSWWLLQTSRPTVIPRHAGQTATYILIGSRIWVGSLRTLNWVIRSSRTVVTHGANASGNIICWSSKSGSLFAEVASVTRTCDIRQLSNSTIVTWK